MTKTKQSFFFDILSLNRHLIRNMIVIGITLLIKNYTALIFALQSH